MTTVPITAIVTAFQRADQTLITIRKLRECEPAPAEILVHVDGDQVKCATTLLTEYSDIGVIVSKENVGPGGGRNKLINAATYPIIASFDDDSYPIDKGYFGRLAELFEKFPQAAIICARIYHPGEIIKIDAKTGQWVADFCGGACAYRRDQFLTTGGYVPLPLAYGMEEVDLALRLHSKSGKILQSDWLRVYHDTDLSRHGTSSVTAASVANIALLAYLRYPVSLWIIGVGQCVNRILWLMRNRRFRGIVRGLSMIPRHLFQNRAFRRRLKSSAIRSYHNLRRTKKTFAV